MSVQEKARARLHALENNPKHTTTTPEAEAETKEDDFGSLANHKLDGDIDSKWHQDSKGNWLHPDYEV